MQKSTAFVKLIYKYWRGGNEMKAPAFMFYPNDWIRDTRILSPLSRGIWVDMLCFMWYAVERGKLEGTPEDFHRQLSCTEREFNKAINEINFKKIADVTICNGIVTVINRRMRKEEKERESTRLRVKRHRNVYVTDDMKRDGNDSGNDKVTPPSSYSYSLTCTKVHYDIAANCFINITKNHLKKWREAFPAINVDQEIKKAEAWVMTHPKNKKSNWEKFLNNWFTFAQDKAPAKREEMRIPKIHVNPYDFCPACGVEVPADEIHDGKCPKCPEAREQAKRELKKLNEYIDRIGKPMPRIDFKEIPDAE
jgi:hypothetical protein